MANDANEGVLEWTWWDCGCVAAKKIGSHCCFGIKHRVRLSPQELSTLLIYHWEPSDPWCRLCFQKRHNVIQYNCSLIVTKLLSALKALQVCRRLITTTAAGKKTQGQFPDERGLNESIIPYLDYLQHLHSGDFAVTIQVIHVEGPVEFLLKAAAGCDGQSADELSEIDGPVSVFVKGSEGVLCKFRRVAVRKELQTCERCSVTQPRLLWVQ